MDSRKRLAFEEDEFERAHQLLYIGSVDAQSRGGIPSAQDPVEPP